MGRKERKHKDRAHKARRKRFIRQERQEAQSRGLSVEQLRAEKFNKNMWGR
ncbi:conserved hypothetical protein [Vibrio phage 416E50-1]|nr:conserved hypothetical protein [Vibrio phage 416E50-1]CAH9012484.1 conserved hypothetical protein [Vibrio phage 284E43-1]